MQATKKDPKESSSKQKMATKVCHNYYVWPYYWSMYWNSQRLNGRLSEHRT